MQDQALTSLPQDVNEDQNITTPPILHSEIHHFNSIYIITKSNTHHMKFYIL